MLLHRIKLVGTYKGLSGSSEDPFEYDFTSAREGFEGITPICLVGLNGSGKSNLIELIADIFSYAERYFNPAFRCYKNLDYDFELIYFIKKEGKDNLVQLFCKSSEVRMSVNDPILENFDYQAVQHNDESPLEYLPSSVVAYSSGQNQGLSSVFAKGQMAFFDAIREQGLFFRRREILYEQLQGRSEQIDSSVRENLLELYRKTISSFPNLFRAQKVRQDNVDEEFDLDVPLYPIPPSLPKGIYFNQQISLLIFISLCVGKRKKFSLFLKEEIGINQLVSFDINFQLNAYRQFDFVNDEVNRFYELASSTEKFDKETNTGTLRYRLDDVFYERLESLFIDESTFYEKLLFLNLLSAKKWSFDEKKSLRTSRYERNVPNVAGGHPPLRVLNVQLELDEPNVTTTYDRLSDGEHQLIQLMCASNVDPKGNSLLILDEPESHFNPEWRSELLSIVEKYSDSELSELIVSTHSPFVVSACPADRMLHFQKSGGNVKIERMSTETYGAAFDTLLKTVFNFGALISKKPLEEIRLLLKDDPRNVDERDNLLERLERFGESFELRIRKHQLRAMFEDQEEERGQ